MADRSCRVACASARSSHASHCEGRSSCHAAAVSAEPGDKPLLRGRGVLLIEDFCRASGLDQDTVQSLMRTGHVQGGLWSDEEQTRPFGIFDDLLPSREDLVAFGLPVSSDYEPDTLRSYEMTDQDDDPDIE